MINITDLAKNFGRIKNAYNDILTEGIITKDKDKKILFKKYINTIKENEILKLQFLVYTNIENKIEPDRFKATQFVNENMNLFSDIKKKDILENNIKLVNDLLFEKDSEEKNNLYENISNLIFLKKNAKDIEKIIESTNFIVDYIVNNQPKTIVEKIELPNSMISVMMVDKYNEKYSVLDETEKKLLKVLIASDDESKKEIYKSIVRECLDIIDVKLVTEDLDIKDKLLKVKDKLLNDKNEIGDDFLKNIIKVNNLVKNLKENEFKN
jgi:hypothetical protein